MPLPPATWPTARQLRVQLASWRAQGAPFDDAWQRALGLLVRDAGWREILEEHREVWRLAYQRQPGPKNLAGLAELVPDVPGFERPVDEERRCEWCEKPIGADRDERARYCSDGCRRRAHYHRIERTAVERPADVRSGDGEGGRTRPAPMEALK